VRGGMVLLQISELVSGEAWPDLSNAALGAWVRLRAAGELTGEPVTARQAGRAGATPELLAELVAAKVVVAADGKYVAIGMPAYVKPSDAPEAVAERMAASRAGLTVAEYRVLKANPSPAPLPVRSGQIRSDQGDALLRVTPRNTDTVTTGNDVTEDGDDRAAEAYAKGPLNCARCGAVILGASFKTSAGRYHSGGCPTQDVAP
jgi:hypothetical protein